MSTMTVYSLCARGHESRCMSGCVSAVTAATAWHTYYMVYSVLADWPECNFAPKALIHVPNQGMGQDWVNKLPSLNALPCTHANIAASRTS